MVFVEILELVSSVYKYLKIECKWLIYIMTSFCDCSGNSSTCCYLIVNSVDSYPEFLSNIMLSGASNDLLSV